MSTTKSTQTLPRADQSRERPSLPPYLAGLIVVLIVGIISWQLDTVIPRLGEVTIAILLGIAVGNLIPDMKRFQPGVKVAEKRLLPIAIALLGVELQLATLLALGPLAALVIAMTIATSFLVSIYLGRALGYPLEFSLLMGAGNGICGSSAVAATSAAIDAREEDIGISISVVNLLGTVGIFALPALVALLGFADIDGGLLIGGTLQAVGQVVAAGFSINEQVGGVATVTKMGRVLMLAPVVIVVSSLVSRKSREGGGSGPRVQVPLFIVGFFVFSLLASLNVLPSLAVNWIATIGDFLLVLAMVGIGMRIQFQALFRSGPKALLFGLVVSVTQIAVVVVLLLLL